MQQKYFTASDCAPCWFALHQQRAKNGWLITYCTHLPHLPALVVTSKAQTTARQNVTSCRFLTKPDHEQTAVVLFFVSVVL